MSDNIYKHFVLLAVLAFWPAAIYMVSKWRVGKGHSFSHHAASERRAYKLFAVAISIETICYVLFIYKWFMPTFDLSWGSGVLFGLIAGGHLISGLVPETKGWARRTHRFAAYGVAGLFIPALLMLALTPSIPWLARAVATFLLLSLSYIGVQYFKPQAHQKFLLYQAFYIATLPVTLITATYIH